MGEVLKYTPVLFKNRSTRLDTSKEYWHSSSIAPEELTKTIIQDFKVWISNAGLNPEHTGVVTYCPTTGDSVGTILYTGTGICE